jgi:hypothetical protein
MSLLQLITVGPYHIVVQKTVEIYMLPAHNPGYLQDPDRLVLPTLGKEYEVCRNFFDRNAHFHYSKKTGLLTNDFFCRNDGMP